MAVAVLSLCHHMDRAHGIVIPHTRGIEVGGRVPDTYVVSFPCVLKLVVCLVDRCLARAHNPGRLRVHFMYQKWYSRVAILQEVPAPLLRCNHCGIHMPESQLDNHRRKARCAKAI